MEENGYIRIIKRLLISCIILLNSNCTNEKINGSNTSYSIDDSNKKGVFIEEYTPINKIVDSSRKYILEECWLEQEWNYKNNRLQIRKLPNYKFVLKISDIGNTDSFTNKLFIDFINVNDSSKIYSEFGYNNDLRVMGLRNKITNDTLILKFIYDNEEKEILLIKKK